jgi:UrcA family protein
MNKSINSIALSIALGATLGAAPTLAQSQQRMEETTITGQTDARSMPVVRKQGVETRRVTVSYADLRLESQAGIHTLYSRIEAAADTVCGVPSYNHGRLMRIHQDWTHCLDDAVDGAISEVNHYGLSQYHLAQTGRRIGLDEQVADR